MSLKDTLTEKLTSLSKAEFNYIETSDISKAAEIDLNCSGIYLEATVVYFEIKNLPYILKENGRRRVAQIYTMYHEVLTSIAKQSGAFVNCFSPEAFLIIYPGKEEGFNEVVKSAMKIANALSNTFKEQFSVITGLEFAMGIDHGHIMGTKNQSDYDVERLTWFGSCIFKARTICKECVRPYHIGISSMIYHNLGEELLTRQRRILGIPKKVDIWNKVTYQTEGSKKHLYQTNHKLELEDTQ